MSQLSQLRSPAAVQAAIDEFVQLGRTKYLARYGFGKSRDFLVRDPKTGIDCDSKAIAGVAFGKQFPDMGPLSADSFSGGEATVVPGLARSTIYKLIGSGEFPRPVPLTGRCVGWIESEVAAWIQSRIEARERV